METLARNKLIKVFDRITNFSYLPALYESYYVKFLKKFNKLNCLYEYIYGRYEGAIPIKYNSYQVRAFGSLLLSSSVKLIVNSLGPFEPAEPIKSKNKI